MDVKHISAWLLLLILVLLSSCGLTEARADHALPDREEITYAIEPGSSEDMACLYADYQDPGATIVVYVNGMRTCRDAAFVPDVYGWVNTRLPGTYSLTYTATDPSGKPVSAVTKTVHVMANSAGFLNGNYDVTCDCTVTASGSPGHTLTTVSYTAASASGSRDRQFKLSLLNIGADYGVSDAVLVGNTIGPGFCFSPDYQVTYLSGALSDAKTTFTISSLVHRYTPQTIYRCQNIYTRHLTIN